MNISIVVPTMGRPDLLQSFLDSFFTRTPRPQDYELCFGFDPSGWFTPGIYDEWTSGEGARWALASGPGMHEAIEAAVDISTGGWLIMAHDDMVFLPGWDDFSFGLDEGLMLCFELLDSKALTWPPAVGLEGAEAEAQRRRSIRTRRVQIGGPFFGTSLCHRSKWVPWPSWSGTIYRTHDTAWMMNTHRLHPEVAFGWMPGNCLYHDISGSVRHKTNVEPDNPREFVETYGTTVEEASGKIYDHSRSLRRDIP